MDFRFMWSADGCDDGQCPSLYLDEATGDYIVQGLHLTESERDALRHLADDESAVRVPASVLDRLLKER